MNELAPDADISVTDVVDTGAARSDDLCKVLRYTVRSHSDFATVDSLDQKEVVITLGHTPLRDEMYVKFKRMGLRFFSIIHPSADVCHSATIEEGCIISPYVLVGTFSKIGANTFVNIRSTIGHDCEIGQSSIISPHVAIGGAAKCGKSTFIGAGAVVNPGVTIGQFTKLASGTVIGKNIDAGAFVHGNPGVARKLFHPESGKSFFGAE